MTDILPAFDGKKNSQNKLKDHVTIIIPVFNQSALTETCIHSIFKHSSGHGFDVLVVDNHSSDGTQEMLARLAQKYVNLGWLRNSRNYGFGIGCNCGASSAGGEYLVFLNNDTEVTPGWLPPLTGPLQKQPDTGIVGPKLLYKNNTLQCGGVVFNHRSYIPYHIYEHFPGDHPAVNKPRYFQAFTGACFAIRIDDFYALEGFEPIYLNGMEDIDLCLRVKKILKKKIFYNPASTVYHLKGKSEGRGGRVIQNRKIFISKWKKEIAVDDVKYYREDGFAVMEYFTTESSKIGEKIAQYYPRLEKKSC